MDLLSDRGARVRVEPALAPQAGAEMLLPAQIGDYTDFYASVYHATNVGRLFRPDNPLLPNYKHVPIGYHGRASSIVVSGADIWRPCGQTKTADAEVPSFGPTRSLDYELEVGFFVGKGNARGEAIPIAEAESHIFGLCLLNDWSARDIQAWEYQPLGPFLAKNFATSDLALGGHDGRAGAVSRTGVRAYRGRSRAFALSHRDWRSSPRRDRPEARSLAEDSQDAGTRMRLRCELSQGNLRDLYWTLAQMLTHHASNGCNLQSGDLLASGTVSGAAPDSLGCLLEITRRGAEPLQLANGETRKFLEDGDEVILRGYCEREGHPRIGFGECRGIVLPAHPC